MSRVQLDLAVKNISFAREYTLETLSGIEPDDWFRQAEGSVSHLAWQIGHLAMAEYGLTMLRIRGKEPADESLISKNFLRKFKKGSTPVFDAAEYPAIEEILAVFHAVHEQALAELSTYTSDDQFAETLPAPYAVYPNKLGSILFCSCHEMLHAGQIGMIRRLLGKPPVR